MILLVDGVARKLSFHKEEIQILHLTIQNSRS